MRMKILNLEFLKFEDLKAEHINESLLAQCDKNAIEGFFIEPVKSSPSILESITEFPDIPADPAKLLKNSQAIDKEICSTVSLKGFGNFTNITDQALVLNTGEFYANDNGIWLKNAKSDIWENICDAPLTVDKILINKDTNATKVIVAFKNYLNEWLHVSTPISFLENSCQIIELSDFGLNIDTHNSKEMVSYLQNLLENNIDIIPRKVSSSNLGWDHGSFKAFVPFFGNTEFDYGSRGTSLFKSVTEKGDPETWRDLLIKLRENPTVRFFTSASAASALIEPLKARPFFVHLYGPSEIGKTVALHAAASMWGNPGIGNLIFPSNTSLATLEQTACVLNSLPLCIDDLHASGLGNIERFISILTSGHERGQSQSVDCVSFQRTWHNAILTCGDEPLLQANSGSAKNKVIELRVSGEKLINDGSEVMTILSRHHGFMGEIFTADVAKMFPEISLRYQALYKYFKNLNSSYASVAIAAIAVADEILTAYFNETPFDPDTWAQFIPDSNIEEQSF
jgi:uncharacterized protein (DUF927 family)